ncbi:S8 family serine peptidase [Candidatus Woesearchaeota archaeon]|nr:S8 family serine peptidase [Candidatus Woesearchaeota archaeon]
MADFEESVSTLEGTLATAADRKAPQSSGVRKVLLGATAIATGIASLGYLVGGRSTPAYDPSGELLVKFESPLTPSAQADGNVVTGLAGVDALNRSIAGESYERLAPVSGEYELDNWFIVDVPQGADVQRLIEQYRSQAGVEWAEANLMVELLPYEVVDANIQPGDTDKPAKGAPNDPFYQSSNSWGHGAEDLWGLRRSNIEGAWNVTRGSDDIIIAVVDTGVDWKHEDIDSRVIHNSGEILDGRDNDRDGYIDNIVGYDFINKDGDAYDDQGHGSHVAGTIAAETNNGVGIAGITWEGRILPVKVLDASGRGTWATVAQGIVYAAKHDADVLNMSLGGPAGAGQKIVDEAISYAVSQGTIIVVAAGNSNSDTRGFSPANNPNVIAVGAMTPDGKRASFSNWGEKNDVGAPGTHILSILAAQHKFGNRAPIVGEHYVVLQGTSMASPHVTGEVALVLAANPELGGDVEAVRAVLREGVDRVETDKYIGTGRINFGAAVELATER